MTTTTEDTMKLTPAQQAIMDRLWDSDGDHYAYAKQARSTDILIHAGLIERVPGKPYMLRLTVRAAQAPDQGQATRTGASARTMAAVTGAREATVTTEHRDPATGELVTDSAETYTAPRTIPVAITVDVDPVAWADEYGVTPGQVRADVVTYLRTALDSSPVPLRVR